jgi:2,3-bisphosphoglycerate-dependent phosphoglycerate mutase
MQQLVLVRHAAATGQEATAPLSAEGQRQAQQLAGLLRSLEVERVISSPFVRAMETIAPFCARSGLQAETDDRLVERFLSAESLPDWRAHLRQSFEDFDYCLPGGESARAAQARGLAVLHDVQASDARCVIVTHGNLLALLLHAFDPTVGFDRWAALSNPDVFVVNAAKDGARTVRRIWQAANE